MLDGFRTGAATALALIAAGAARCGSSSDGGGTATGAARSGGKVDVAAARAGVAQYSGRPTAFPVDQPLKARPTGKTFAFLQCSTPACALFAQAIAPTQKLLGYRLKVVKAGPSASDVQSAMSSIVSLRPDGVLLPASDPQQYPQQLRALLDARVAISANGVVGADRLGLRGTFINDATDRLVGKIMADWAVAQTGGGEIAFYGVPELSFTPLIREGFDAEVTALCPSCDVRHVDLPIASIGTTAPNRVVSDLQSHPKTRAAVFGTAEAGTGLPAALQSARLRVKLMGFGPPPAVLAYIKQGQWDAGVGVDAATMIWSQVDELARMVAGQPLTAGETQGLPPIQILTKADITFDASRGYVAYPDFPARFAKLWGAAK